MNPKIIFIIALTLLATVLSSLQLTQARPEYASAETLPCASCHASVSGGGPRLALGRYFQENGYSTMGYKESTSNTAVVSADAERERSRINLHLSIKSWSTTVVLVLAVATFSLMAVLRLLLKLGRHIPPIVLAFHRFAGYTLVLLVLALAIYCLVALGIDMSVPRSAWHGVLGFALIVLLGLKIVVIRLQLRPWQVCLWLGGAITVVTILLFLSSAWWYFTSFS